MVHVQVTTAHLVIAFGPRNAAAPLTFAQGMQARPRVLSLPLAEPCRPQQLAHQALSIKQTQSCLAVHGW